MRVDELRSAAYALMAYSGMEYGKFSETHMRYVPREVFDEHKHRLPESWRKRAEHWFTEYERVEAGAEAWRKGDIEKFGKLISESGRSSIDNWETGSPELIKLYEIMTQTKGIYGGRFSGAGFMGCCMALIDPAFEKSILEKVEREYIRAFPHLKGKYSAHICNTSDGVKLRTKQLWEENIMNILNVDKKVLVTGAAGFIGYYLSKRLLIYGCTVVGADNLNDYCDVSLKQTRLDQLKPYDKFRFIKMDISDKKAIDELFEAEKFDIVVNLAAQAGVRYSITNPDAYINSNIIGFFNILEACRHNPVDHLIYASSSSVYGSNKKVPYSTDDKVDNPVSLYAATKKSNELMAHAYSKLYKIPTTGLRFFTVYGPMGR